MLRRVRILYGVTGEGMGHATRSRVILDHLTKENEVAIMASGRAVDFLGNRFEGVSRIHGLHMIYEENRVRIGKTLFSNVLSGALGVPKNIAAYFELISEFKPDVVISDFESWTYLYGKTHRLPVLSIDNMQIIHRCKHDEAIIEGHRKDFELAKAFVKGKLPFCNEYFITTFFRPEIRKPNTHLFPPILRQEILAAKPERGEHLLVYQTGEGNEALATHLEASGFPCRVYGMRRDLKEDVAEGNLLYRPFSEAQFIDDLRTSRAVVAGGGFTLMGEAIYLKKPMLCLPLRGQFEQVLNARYLELEGFGKEAHDLSDKSELEGFLAKLPQYEAALAKTTHDGNRGILEAVDEFLLRVRADVA